MRFPLALCFAVALAFPAAKPKKTTPAATAPTKPTLTVDHLMRGNNLYGYEPKEVRWSGDNQRLYFRWKQWADTPEHDFDLYVVNRDGTGQRKLTEEEAKLAPPLNPVLTRDKTQALYTQSGDLWHYDYVRDLAHPLTKTTDVEANPRWILDGKRVAYTRSSNLYLLSLETGFIEQLTDIRSGTAPPEPDKKGTDSQEFIKKEEESLLEIVRKRAEKKKDDEAKKKADNPRKPFYLGAKLQVAGLALTGDEKYVVAFLRETASDAKTAAVPNYITSSVYSEQIPTRTKVGDLQAASKLAIINVSTGELKYVDAGLKEKEKARQIQWSSLVFNDTLERAVVRARATDNKDEWLFALDWEQAKVRQLLNIHDDAWVLWGRSQSMGWLKGGRDIWFLAELPDYLHLYTLPYDGGTPKALTAGKWEVVSAELSRDQQTFYLVTNETHPGEQHLYSMPVTGGARTRLSTKVGQYEATRSPDDKSVAVLYSGMTAPPELYLLENGGAMKALTQSPSPDFSKYKWQEVPVVTFKARDGVDVYARLYKPANAVKNGPAVIFVHGAGYLQNAHKWWSNYAQSYLFHHLLMEMGYTVLDLDYRGSAGYGRDWRTGIYRYMGGKDLDDHVDGAKWLVAQHGVDPKCIGLYGGSYGGFITLMAMFTQPDVFAAGAALRPVTDWAQYNHPYTANILNEPQKDPEAYKRSSPIYFAQNLKGALLICHGMVDTNVHFQDSVRLAQRLIELRKENWELAAYPVEDHGFVQPSSWADEFKRILKLFELNLKPAK
ncbi:MAG: S9 family peptidase [Bryobacteraceae bacterium]|nr:S9 family peptidase [Bryobacteraceae bacterium]